MKLSAPIPKRKSSARRLQRVYVRDRLTSVVDVERSNGSEVRTMTATEVLQAAGIEYPTNGQAKECAGILREWFGESKRINGRDKWRVPMRPSAEKPDTDDATDRPVHKSKFD